MIQMTILIRWCISKEESFEQVYLVGVRGWIILFNSLFLMKLLKDVNWSKSCDFGGRLIFVDKLDVRFALLHHIRLQVAHIPPLILLIVVLKHSSTNWFDPPP